MSCCGNETNLMPIEKALEIIVHDLQPCQQAELIDIHQAGARVISQDIVSGINVPPKDNSAMDGYAFRWQDFQAGKTLPVSQRIAAGEVGTPLAAGTVARIFTGAEIPPGADTVVKQELTQLTNDGIVINTEPSLGEHIRPAGQDIAVGSKLINQGTVLSPRHIGVLASIGIADIPVYQKLRVALVNTGDELVMLGEICPAGKIYNSNYFTIRGLLQDMCCEVQSISALKDTKQAVVQALNQASQRADLVITTGGVSVGEEDHVKQVVEELGSLKLWRLAIKPGKPLAYGEIQGTLFLGLPGNPVAAFVTFLLIGLPFIRRLQGAQHQPPQLIPVMADFSFKANPRQTCLRANINIIDGQIWATPLTNQSSGALSSTVMSEGLIVVPSNTHVKPGDSLHYLAYSAFS